MGKIVMQSISKLMGGKSERSDHALNDVAVVAKQPTWLLAVMAMVGAWRFVSERASAYPALAILKTQEFGKRLGRHAGPVLSGGVEFFATLHRICFDLLPSRLLKAFSFTSRLTSCNHFRLAVIGQSARPSGLRPVVFPGSFENGRAVLAVIFALRNLVPVPLLRRAVALFHTGITPLETRPFLARGA